MKPVISAGVSPEIRCGSATDRHKTANRSTEFSELLSRQEARLHSIGQHLPEEELVSVKEHGSDPESVSEGAIVLDVPCAQTVETNELVPDDLTAFQAFVPVIVNRIDTVALHEDEANPLGLPAARSFEPDPVQHQMPDVHGLVQDDVQNSSVSDSAGLPDQGRIDVKGDAPAESDHDLQAAMMPNHPTVEESDSAQGDRLGQPGNESSRKQFKLADTSESEKPMERSDGNATEGPTAHPDVQSSVQTGIQALIKPSELSAVRQQDPPSRHAVDLAVERMDFRTVENQAVLKPTAHAEIQPAPAQESQPPAFAGDDLARQVASAVLRNRQNGESRLTVRLKPDQWGTLEIQLIRSEDGLVARIQSDRQETCQLLRERIPLLQESLHSPGAASRVEIQYQESASGGMTFGRDQSASQQGSDGSPEPLPFRQPDPDRPTAVDRGRPLAPHRPTHGRLIDRWA